MYKIFSFFTVLIFPILLISCVSTLRPPSANATGPRTIILNDKVISEDEVGGFTSWYCRDYVHEDRVLLEFGYLNDPNFSGIGFILYDGGYTGEFTYYQRTGVEL
jgi:hypothetical protein